MAMEKTVSLKESRARVMTAPVDEELEDRMVPWIEEVTGEYRKTLTTANWLKNGKILCILMNHIQPHAVKIRRSLVPTDKLENIQKFIGAATGLGVPVFDPFDLYDGTDMTKVLKCVEGLRDLDPAKVAELKVVPQTSDMGHNLSINIDAKMIASASDVHDTNVDDDDDGDAGDAENKSGDKGKGEEPGPTQGAIPPRKFLPSTGNFAGPVSPRGGILLIETPELQQAKSFDVAPPLQKGVLQAPMPGSVSIDTVGSKPRAVQETNEAGNCCANCVLQ